MPVKVYLASQGSYSDYSVSCAFTTKELAVAYIARMNDLTIEEQAELSRVEALSYPDRVQAQRALPKKLRELWDAFFVEELDLYDELPLADA